MSSEQVAPARVDVAGAALVVVALAAKLARIAWAVLARGCDYDAQFESAAAAA